MYNVDDAVAKVDGYIISVTEGGPHVGDKRLVRIEEAGRTAAVASLVDNGGNGAAARRWRRLDLPAPWPQRRTAPFRCPSSLLGVDMYAIVKTGGKQYRVERDQTLLVERLPAEQGDTVALEPILFRSDDTVFDADGLKKVKVGAEIVEHLRGPKLRVFKHKPKRGYRKRTGHRQELTRIRITEISHGA